MYAAMDGPKIAAQGPAYIHVDLDVSVMYVVTYVCSCRKGWIETRVDDVRVYCIAGKADLHVSLPLLGIGIRFHGDLC